MEEGACEVGVPHSLQCAAKKHTQREMECNRAITGWLATERASEDGLLSLHHLQGWHGTLRQQKAEQAKSGARRRFCLRIGVGD